MQSFELFDFAYIGIPLTVCSIIYFVLFGYRLLPSNESIKEQQALDYFLEVKVTNNSSLIGKTIEENNIRNLESLFLAEIIRNEKLISPVSPDEIVEEDDAEVEDGKDGNDDKKNSAGMRIMTVDSTKTVLINLKLEAKEFSTFICKPAKLELGVSLVTFNKLIKSMDKDDTLRLYVEEEDKQHLVIEIENQEKDCTTVYKLKLMDYFFDNPECSINTIWKVYDKSNNLSSKKNL
jgi:hypothetical protein